MEKTDKTKKAEINAILEKYNLKTPKKSKTNAIPTNFEIKPKDGNSNVIHVVKSAPVSTTISPNPDLGSIPMRPISQPEIPRSPQKPIQPPQQIIKPVLVDTVRKESNNNNNNEASVKNILANDNKLTQMKKLEMPRAVISKNHPKNVIDKVNMFDFIPTVKTTSIEPHPSNTNANTNNAPISTPIVKKPGPQFKTISINPNLSEDESQNYKGSGGSPGSGGSNNSNPPQSIKQIQTNKPTQIIPTPIKNIMNEQKQHQNNQSKFISQNNQPKSSSQNNHTTLPKKPEEIKRVNVDMAIPKANPGISGGGNRSKNAVKQSPEMVEPGLSYLEEQRRELVRQQMAEIERFKKKKAEIIKMKTRKQEIELMKSIEAEKVKLRKIQAKQHELDNIYKNTVSQETVRNNSGQTVRNIIVDIDAKKTRKRLPNQSSIDKPHIPISKKPLTKLQPKPEPIPIPKDNAIPTLPIESVPKIIKQSGKGIDPFPSKDKADLEKNPNPGKDKADLEKNPIPGKDKADLDKDQGPGKDKADLEKNPGPSKDKADFDKDSGPLKYYFKKDKPSLKWPANKDIYNPESYTDKLETISGIPELFNRKQKNDKTPRMEMIKALRDICNFNKIERLDSHQDYILELLYRSMILDKMEFKNLTNYINYKQKDWMAL